MDQETTRRTGYLIVFLCALLVTRIAEAQTYTFQEGENGYTGSGEVYIKEEAPMLSNGYVFRDSKCN